MGPRKREKSPLGLGFGGRLGWHGGWLSGGRSSPPGPQVRTTGRFACPSPPLGWVSLEGYLSILIICFLVGKVGRLIPASRGGGEV